MMVLVNTCNSYLYRLVAISSVNTAFVFLFGQSLCLPIKPRCRFGGKCQSSDIVKYITVAADYKEVVKESMVIRTLACVNFISLQEVVVRVRDGHCKIYVLGFCSYNCALNTLKCSARCSQIVSVP